MRSQLWRTRAHKSFWLLSASLSFCCWIYDLSEVGSCARTSGLLKETQDFYFQILIASSSQTFCTRCLFRSLDHSQTCPLCRQKLPGYDYFQQHPCNKVILAISK